MFGQSPGLGNLEPQVTGFLVLPQGNTSDPYPRGEDEGVQPIEVPATHVDLWFAFSDDETAVADLAYNKLKIATSVLGFATVPEITLNTGSVMSGPEFSGSSTTFTHKTTIDLSGHASGTQLFVRAYVDDGDHGGPTEIPNDGTGSPMVDYFTLRIIP